MSEAGQHHGSESDMASVPPESAPGVGRRRLIVFALVAGLAALDLAIKAWAERRLAGGRSVEIGWVDLQLAFNPGVAFSLGATLPSGVVLGVTGVLITGLTVLAWRTTLTGAAVPFSLAAVLAGAVGNFADRAADGVVTDYLHTGWFPTFNGADVLVTAGAAALALASLRPQTLPQTR